MIFMQRSIAADAYTFTMRGLMLCVLLLGSPAMAENLVLVNGTVIDGTGKARVLANVRIRDGRVADLGPFRPAAGEMVLDVKGLIVAPGFIDLQSLSPSTIQRDPAAASLVMAGVTT